MSFITDFESDILRLYGYSTLENLLNVPARTIKTREQETLFLNFMQTLTNLEGTSFSRITAIINNSFEIQQQPPYAETMEFIRQYLNGDGQTTSTESTNTQPTATTPSSSASLMDIQIFTVVASLSTILSLKM